MGGRGNKRVQVALRPPVLSIVEHYATGQGISNSAAIARMVEEGLTRRGMLEGKGGFTEISMGSVVEPLAPSIEPDEDLTEVEELRELNQQLQRALLRVINGEH